MRNMKKLNYKIIIVIVGNIIRNLGAIPVFSKAGESSALMVGFLYVTKLLGLQCPGILNGRIDNTSPYFIGLW